VSGNIIGLGILLADEKDGPFEIDIQGFSAAHGSIYD